MAKIEPFYAAFGARLRRIREDRQLTQSEVGAALDPPMTRAAIANIEGASQRVLAHTVEQLALVLWVSTEELMTGERRG